MISIENLSFSYGSNLVLDKLNFKIDSNQCIGIMGESGCGKSTLLDCLAGFQRPQGTIKISDKTILSDHAFTPPHQREIGVIFQQAHLFPHLNIAQNICYALDELNMEVVKFWLDFMEVNEKSSKMPFELSGGQQQRIAIARTLAASPKFILMDEPYSSLDHKLKLLLRTKINQYLKSKKIPSLLVTHQLEEALSTCESFFLLKDSQLIDLGATSQFSLENLDPNIKEFFK